MSDFVLNKIQDLARWISGRLGRDSWFICKARPFYERALAALAPSSAVPRSINGEPFRIDPRYRHLLSENYERPVADFLKRNVRPGDVCFDVGANVGIYVLQLGRLVSARGKIVAFEPNPAAREVMERHAELNGLQDRLLVVPAAVGEHSGERAFYSVRENATARLDEPNTTAAPDSIRSTVMVTSIDEFVDRTGIEPRWILMDIEGHELQALLGSRRTIERLKGRIGFIVEMHPGAWPGIGAERSAVERLFSQLQLRHEGLTGQKDPLTEYGHIYLS